MDVPMELMRMEYKLHHHRMLTIARQQAAMYCDRLGSLEFAIIYISRYFKRPDLAMLIERDMQIRDMKPRFDVVLQFATVTRFSVLFCLF